MPVATPLAPALVPVARHATELRDFELAEAPVRRRGRAPRSGWLPAVVPGGVHESLLAAGVIEHPYRDDAEADAEWIEEREWWYRTAFDAPVGLAPGERVRLVFEGLDTIVDIRLNGRRLGRHRNMFRPAAFDVTDRLRAVNTLELRFTPPLAGVRLPLSAIRLAARAAKLEQTLGDIEVDVEHSKRVARGTTRRKATFSWGWDFGPRVPSIGIWQPVRLVRERVAVISGVHARALAVDAAARTARLALDVEVDVLEPAALTARARITAPSGEVVDVPLATRAGGFAATVDLIDAELWWTHDLGDSALYDVRIELSARGELLDARELRTGLRTIEIDRSPDPEGGRLFRFMLNGVPVFARGASWVPNDLLVGSIPAEVVRDRVLRAREGGMTMLRIWGGGIYEQDAFYDACDESGVLVWQDFLFASFVYPSGRRELQREVRAEAEHQVRRLRSHASLAVWCGNNEVQMVRAFVWHDTRPGDWGWHFFHRDLPEIVARLDASVPYWPGSPWGEDEHEGWMAVNGVRDGDRHAWEVWHGVDIGAGDRGFESVGESRHYRRYADDDGKFISEFGIHAAPVLSTLEKWTTPGSLAVHSSAFEHRNKDMPKDKHDAILEIVTGLPTTMQEYVDFTMASQAEGLKFGIEHYRRRQPHCSGALIWQFNDVWPGFSWSIVDYEGVPKAGYYAARRAFAPVLASFRRAEDGGLELWVSNSGRAAYEGRLVVEVVGFDGAVHASHEISASVAAGASEVVWVGVVEPAADRALWVTVDNVPASRCFLAEIRELDLPHATLEIERGDGVVRVTARGYAYAVVLEPAEPLARLSDNYRDIRDGETVEYRLEGADATAVVVRGYAGQEVTVVER